MASDTTDLLATAKAWHDEDPDPVTRAELDDLLAAAGAGDEAAVADLRDRFAGRLEFGTAGLRGAMGAGPNRMNEAVVVRTTAGLAAYLDDQGRRGQPVIVGFDARHRSADFAAAAASVLAAAGFPVLLADRPVPTPVLAFGVLQRECCAGIQVTASHNPPADNGYKVYLGDGAQIVPPADAEISARIDAVGPLASIPRDPSSPRIGPVGHDLVAAYVSAAVATALRSPDRPRDVGVVYTPMHGVGRDVLVPAFERAGFGTPRVVTEQGDPDPDFPTVAFPNPEEPGALDLALALARASGADVVIANDPDADRLAVAVPTGGPATGGDRRPPPGDHTSDPATGGWRRLPGDEITDAATGGWRPLSDDDTSNPATGGDPRPLPGDELTDPATGGDRRPSPGDELTDPATGGDRRPLPGDDTNHPATGGRWRPLSGNDTNHPATGGDWRPLSGDEIGILLADWLLGHGEGPDRLVATTIVSSSMLGRLAEARGVRYEETLTGFKWIMRPVLAHPELDFVYGYEEALGSCVDRLVHDKDGITAALAFTELVASEKAAGRTVLDRLDDLTRELGVHATGQRSVVVPGAEGQARMREIVDALAAAPPSTLAGRPVTSVDDLRPGGRLPPADAVILRGEGVRLIVRPSGTEPKLKCYAEAVVPADASTDLPAARAAGATLVATLLDEALTLAT